MSQTYSAIALCALGLERVLSRELERLGFEPEGRSTGRVFFKADEAGLFRANLSLRTAERILLEVARFRAPDFDALFEGAREPAWELFFAPEDRLVIERVRCKDSRLAAQTSVQSVAHKAIYEKLGAVHGLSRLPETGFERSLRVYIEDDVCTIGLDLSGEALHKRGYRQSSGEAPLKETIAAGVLLLAGWNRRLPLLDPFCGSGTLLIEAGLFGLDMAPGLKRSFALETMPLAVASVFEAEREAARARIRSDVELLLVGSDTNREVLAAAEANAERAGLGGRIKFSVAKAEDAAPFGPEGVLIANPPYGERLGTEEDALALYRRLAPFAERFKGWGLGFVTNRADFGSYFGRRAVSEHKIMNGAEEQWFHWYPIGFESKPERPPREVEAKRREGGSGASSPRARGEGRGAGGERPDRAERPHRPWVGPDKPGWKPRGERPVGERRDGEDRRGGGDRREAGRRPAYAARRDEGDREAPRRPWGGRQGEGGRSTHGGQREEGRPFSHGPRREEERKPFRAPRREGEGQDRPHRDAPRREAPYREAPRHESPRRDSPRGEPRRPQTEGRSGPPPSNKGPAKPILRRKEETDRSKRAQKPLWSERPKPEELGKKGKPSAFGGSRGPGRKREDEGSED